MSSERQAFNNGFDKGYEKGRERIAQLEAENEKLKEAIKLDFHEGQMEVDKALAEFGYDSLRFADVRHGWIFSTRHGIDILKGDDDETE